MTAEEFRRRLAALSISQERFGRITDNHKVTVFNWGKARSGRKLAAVPHWVSLLLDAWERYPGLIPPDDKPRKKTFKEYLRSVKPARTENYDFVRDARMDSSFPDVNSWQALKAYLEDVDAMAMAKIAARRVWRSYKESIRQ